MFQKFCSLIEKILLKKLISLVESNAKEWEAI